MVTSSTVVVPTRGDMLAWIPLGSAIAELGVFTGDFAEELWTKCRPSELFLIDIWQGRMGSGDKDGKHFVDIPDMSLVYAQLHERWVPHPEVRLCRGTTNAVLSAFPDKRLGFIYVDADHTYAGAHDDLELSVRKVCDGGLIGGHDYCPAFPGVTEAVDQFCREHGWRMCVITQDGCPSYLLEKS